MVVGIPGYSARYRKSHQLCHEVFAPITGVPMPCASLRAARAVESNLKGERVLAKHCLSQSPATNRFEPIERRDRKLVELRPKQTHGPNGGRPNFKNVVAFIRVNDTAGPRKHFQRSI